MALRAGAAFGRTMAGLALAAWAAFGCATSPPLEYTPEDLREEAMRRASSLEASGVDVPYEVGPAAVARARQLLRGQEPSMRVRALVDSLSAPDGFGLRYEWATSGSARATLERGAGNCFALSSVLIGLARGLGLRAYYVEVRVARPEWRNDGQVMVQADHIAALVKGGMEKLYVDFTGELERAHEVRVIGDLEALAHYYNNRGYELMYTAENAGQPIPWEAVLDTFQVATRLEPSMARAWSNLGVARARLGDAEGAKRAYHRALALPGDTQSAHLNLALLHLREGEHEAAAEHVRQAGELDPRNPQLKGLREALERARVAPDASAAD